MSDRHCRRRSSDGTYFRSQASHLICLRSFGPCSIRHMPLGKVQVAQTIGCVPKGTEPNIEASPYLLFRVFGYPMVVNAVRPRLYFPSYPVAPTSLLTAHRRAGLGALAWSLIQGLYGLSYLLAAITVASSPAGFTVIGLSPIPGNGFPPLGACPAPTMDGLAGTVSGSPIFQVAVGRKGYYP